MFFTPKMNIKLQDIHVLQQQAYPAMRTPVDVQNSAIPGVIHQNSAIHGAIHPKLEKTCLRCGRTAVQNFTPIGKANLQQRYAEKSVTVHNK